MQYHTNTADWKYQLLFVVNFIKLHVTACKMEIRQKAANGNYFSGMLHLPVSILRLGFPEV